MSGLFGHTEAGVADIREMIRRSKSKRFDKGFRWHPSGGSRPVVVRLEEDIDEDDFDEHPAEVLDNGRRTKTYVMVRNAGQLPLEKDAKLTAIPIPNAGLCVCGNERPSTFQPLNVGILKAHRDALRAYNPSVDMGRAFTQAIPSSSLYHGLNLEELTQRNYLLNENQRLHVVCVGMPPFADTNDAWGFLSTRQIISSATPAQIEQGYKQVQSAWVPEEGSAEEFAINQYLADGGIVLCIVEQAPVYSTTGLGTFFSGELAVTGTRYVWEPVLQQRDKLQAWLQRVGSSVQILNREQIVPPLPARPPQWPEPVLGCSHTSVLPPNGFMVINPDTWLGRSKGIRRINDMRQLAKFAEMDAFRGGGWAAMRTPGQNSYQTAFFESNGAWTPQVWQSIGLDPNGFNANANSFTAWTNGQMFGLSAPVSVWFSAVHVGQRFWTNRFQFGPPELSIGRTPGSTFLYGYEFTRQSDGIIYIDPATVFPIPTATAERLPNGGRLVVTTRAAFPMVAEALVRSIQSGDMLELTTHFTGRGGAFVDRFGRDVNATFDTQLKLAKFTPSNFNGPYRVFARGEGFAHQHPRGAIGEPIPTASVQLQTLPQPEGAPLFSYRPNRDGTKTGWTALQGITSIWPTVSEEVADDSSGAFSAIDSGLPLTLFFEPVDAPASTAPVTVTLRAAKCNASGLPTSAGSASIVLELLGGQSPPVVSVFVADLSETIQEITWTFNATERDWAFNFGANPRIRFTPNASGCGVLLTYVAINAGQSSRFQSLLILMSTSPVALTTNLAACPWAHSYRGDHPVFNDFLVPSATNPLSGGNTASKFCVAYSEADLSAWRHAEFGLLTTGASAAPAWLSNDKFWRLGRTLQVAGNDRFSNVERIVSMVVQRPAGSSQFVSITGPGMTGTPDTFPVLFQNGRLLRPPLWEFTRDVYVAEYPEFSSGRYTLFDRERARTRLTGWQDITNWPEVSEDPRDGVDIQTEPDSPPVCIGVGTVTELRYGVSGTQKYTVNISGGIADLDFAIQHRTEDVRAIWQQNYGGAS